MSRPSGRHTPVCLGLTGQSGSRPCRIKAWMPLNSPPSRGFIVPACALSLGSPRPQHHGAKQALPVGSLLRQLVPGAFQRAPFLRWPGLVQTPVTPHLGNSPDPSPAGAPQPGTLEAPASSSAFSTGWPSSEGGWHGVLLSLPVGSEPGRCWWAWSPQAEASTPSLSHVPCSALGHADRLHVGPRVCLGSCGQSRLRTPSSHLCRFT